MSKHKLEIQVDFFSSFPKFIGFEGGLITRMLECWGESKKNPESGFTFYGWHIKDFCSNYIKSSNRSQRLFVDSALCRAVGQPMWSSSQKTAATMPRPPSAVYSHSNKLERHSNQIDKKRIE